MKLLRQTLALFLSLCIYSFVPSTLQTFAEDQVETSCESKVRWNALEYGVTTDEEADNTEALQRALDAASASGGGIVELSAGRFRFNGVLSIPQGVTLQGVYRVPPTIVNKDEKPTGTILLSYANRGKDDGEPFITLAGSNSALIGVGVIYPEWSRDDVPPTPYPPCVYSKNTCNVAVIDCCLLNPYEGIHFELAHRFLIRNITGYPSYRGIFVDECYDIGRIENVHFWPFGLIYEANEPYCKWINQNASAFEFARTDWIYVTNTFCFGYGRGYYFSDCGHGGTNGNFLGIGADSCQRAVMVEQSQQQGLLIANGEFVGRWSSEDSVCLEIGEENEGTVSLTNCSFWGPIKNCVHSKSAKGRVVLTSCDFVNWDELHSSKVKAGEPAVRIDAGRATLVGNSFERSGVHLFVGDDATFVSATGNQAVGGFRTKGNRAPTKLLLSANEPDIMELLPGANKNYVVHLGERGDERFVKRWYGQEKDDVRTFRWSGSSSYLTFPIPQETKKVVVEMELEAPDEAIGEGEKTNADDLGVFVGNEKVADISKGNNKIRFERILKNEDLNEDGELQVNIRCFTFKPKERRENSNDERDLGVVGFYARVQCDDYDEKIFNANRGDWD